MTRWAAAALVLAAVTAAGCSVPGDDPAAPSTTASTALPALEDGYVLAGSSPYDVRLYRAVRGRFTDVGGAADLDGATRVSARGDTVVVQFDDSAGRQTIKQLDDGRLTDLGIASGFDPSVSTSGQLAWASSALTRGPDRATVFVRSSLTGEQRTVATIPDDVVGSPAVVSVDWAGSDLVVGVVRQGVITALRFPRGRGPARTVATLDVLRDPENGGQTSGVVAGGSTAVLTTELDNTVASLDGREIGSIGLDDDPLCVTDDDHILTGVDSTLRLVTAHGGSRRTVGRLPGSRFAFDASCP